MSDADKTSAELAAQGAPWVGGGGGELDLMNMKILDFKISTCSECCILTFW